MAPGEAWWLNLSLARLLNLRKSRACPKELSRKKSRSHWDFLTFYLYEHVWTHILQHAANHGISCIWGRIARSFPCTVEHPVTTGKHVSFTPSCSGSSMSNQLSPTPNTATPTTIWWTLSSPPFFHRMILTHSNLSPCLAWLLDPPACQDVDLRLPRGAGEENDLLLVRRSTSPRPCADRCAEVCLQFSLHVTKRNAEEKPG